MMAASAATGAIVKGGIGYATTTSLGLFVTGALTGVVGAAASTVILGVAAAAASGAAVGLLKSYVDYKKEAKLQPKTNLFGEHQPTIANKFWTLKTLKATASGAAMSAATFGAFDAVERVTGINIGKSIFDMAGRGLTAAFNTAGRVAEIAQEKIIAAVANTHWYKDALTDTLRNYDYANGLNAAKGKIKFDAPFDATQHKATVGANQNISNASRDAALAKVRAWEATQVKAPVAAPASATVATPAGLEGRTLEETKFGDDTGMTVPRDMPDVQMPDPTKPVEIEIKTADGETTIIKAQPMPNMTREYAIAQQALNNEYIADRLRGEVHGLTGKAPNADMSVEEMAKLVVPRNPDTYLRVLAQEAADKAVKLDPTKMAAACVTDLPQTSEALAQQGNVIPNTCAIAKGMEDMAEGDYVLVRDAAEQAPSTKRGIRALFKQAIDGATAQVKEKTASFIDKVVAGYEIPDMTQQKIAENTTTEIGRHQVLAMAPNP
jgi:hypothetical protein